MLLMLLMCLEVKVKALFFNYRVVINKRYKV